MVFKWKKQSDDIARVISKRDVGGVFSKSIILSPNEKAVMVKNGLVEEIIDSGKLRVGGLFKPGNIRKDVDVALMDTSAKDLEWEYAGMWTYDDQNVGCKGLLRFRIQDQKRFFQMLFSYTTPAKNGERALSVQDIYQHLKSETITRVLEPEIRQVSIENIYGNRDLQLTMENELEMQLKSTLSMWGLELMKYTVQWDLGSYAEVMAKRNEYQTHEELKEMDTLSIEGDHERAGRVDVAGVRAEQATVSARVDFERDQQLKGVKSQLEIEQLEDEADIRAAREALKLKEDMHLSKARGVRAELEVEQDMQDREHTRDMEYVRTVTEAGGADTAKTISEGREFGSLSPEQIAALAKVRESEARAKDDKLDLMMKVEDREREDSYRRQDMDAKMMGAAQAKRSPNVRKCPSCGATIPAEAKFCGQCGTKL
ncbi:MAG: zinc-ribbon domain-containing protein [Euryarchaeota archaeon]|nr:zinc-ribbon domain-containing protein [Euryarchaeota archaeon]